MSRRRGSPDPAFGSDSFLDVIANLVGIVLIIIVLIGARIRELPNLAPAAAPAAATPASESAAAKAELDHYRAEIAALQKRLLELLRALDLAQQDRQRLERESGDLTARQAAARGLLPQVEEQTAAHRQALAQKESDLPRLRERLAELQRAVQELEARPLEKRALQYHLPVSKVVGAEEYIFECQQGRVTFADVQALLEEVRRVLPDKGAELRSRWELTDFAGPVGAFRLQYTLARERTALDQAFHNLPPADDRRFQYGLAKWELAPAWPVRGETAREALADRSRFRSLIDDLDPEQSVLTFFVYPDSFELYRTLRDHLYDRGFVVAGRPLPPGQAIVGSRTGSASRGQ